MNLHGSPAILSGSPAFLYVLTLSQHADDGSKAFVEAVSGTGSLSEPVTKVTPALVGSVCNRFTQPCLLTLAVEGVLVPTATKLEKCYDRRTKDCRLAKMDEALLVFSVAFCRHGAGA